MRRAAILSTLFAVGLASLGCKHVAGQHDCTYNPSNVPMPVTSNPYQVVGPSIGGFGTPAPVETVPIPTKKTDMMVPVDIGK